MSMYDGISAHYINVRGASSMKILLIFGVKEEGSSNSDRDAQISRPTPIFSAQIS